MRTVAEIERAWHLMMSNKNSAGDNALWTKASKLMRDYQRDGVDEDRAAEQAMVDIGWIPPVMSCAGEQAAEEYEEAMLAQELMGDWK